MKKRFFLTKDGLDRIKKEYAALKKARRAKLKGQDDVPEVLHSEELNPDFVYFQEDLNFIESRLAELEYVLNNGEPIKAPKGKENKVVNIGATVLIETDGQSDEFIIVETFEADPATGKISKESPVGKALMGSREGEEVKVFSPTKTTYKIKKVKYHLS